jgi:predicted Zn-dependent protease with MMP-like domain
VTEPNDPDRPLIDHGVDVDAVIADVLDRLPEPFKERLDSVAIVLEDEATPEQLARLQVRGLFGLYEGVPRTRWGAGDATVANKITLFLGPLGRANPFPNRFRAAIEDTLLHEIAHHFGIDDARLRELAAERRGTA